MVILYLHFQPQRIDGLKILKDQNPSTPLEINLFCNRQHTFYECKPEIFFYSQGPHANMKKNNEISIYIISSVPETKLFTVPEKNKIKRGKK